MYKYLFGPVPSRRLGMSLGIDLVPKKVCSLDCVYCEVGASTKLTTRKQEYILYDKIIKELDNYFANNPDPDFITITGSGEPTLNIRVEDLISYIKQIKPNVKVAVITNGTLFYDEQVRKSLMLADLVLPSLDAATQEVFEKINRPQEDLRADKSIEGLIQFAKEYKGDIWLEIFILPGYNDHAEELIKLKEAIVKINPTQIQLNTLDRPGVLTGLKTAAKEDLEEIIKFWDLDNVIIISKAHEREQLESYREDTETAIIGTIVRRPCTAEDLTQMLGMHINEVNKYLSVMEANGKIKQVEEERGIFYQIA
jgi:wyosine [tRNA(Phe)-imidazoG37] synthetase (radical SAM superfamily)